MTNYRITYRGATTSPAGARFEDVEAEYFQENGDWTDFYISVAQSPRVKLRVRSADIARVEISTP